MKKATLIIMAAGIGSRFGGGIKQLEPVGPNGEIIIEYSIYDAIEAGFDKVVFVIRKDLEKDFKNIIGEKIEKKIEVEYVFQEVSDIPAEFNERFSERVKPWGTGQAVLCCKDVVDTPFLVINADDFYGKESFKLAYRYLQQLNVKSESEKLVGCMVGFVLKNTLSDNGGVTRGICKINTDNILTEIMEVHNIIKTETGAGVCKNGELSEIDSESVVSMNMWGFTPEIFRILEDGFHEFLAGLNSSNAKEEYLLPTIVGALVADRKMEVRVLKTAAKWFGVTYKEDKASVIEEVKKIVLLGDYDLD